MKKTMKKLRRVVWALLLSALMIVEPVAGSVVTYAAEITEEEPAPVIEDENDGSESGQEDSNEDVDSVETSDGEDSLQSRKEIKWPTDEELEAWARSTGHVPNGYYDIDYEVEGLSEPVAASDRSFAMAKATVIPNQYDAREHDQVSSVKNQAGWGTCWAFSAVAAAESAYKIQHGGAEADFSETQLVHFFYNGNIDADLEGPDGGLAGDKTTSLSLSPVQIGGNSYWTTFALAGWTGIVDEATDPSLEYPDAAYTYYSDNLSIDSKYAYADAMHLENAYWIPLSDRDSVKKAVMEYGSIGVNYYYDATYDSDSYKSYVDFSYDGPAVYYDPFDESTNHAVAIVGWDDSFDKNNFSYTYYNAYLESQGKDIILPEENGAWLIKNSWGSEWLDEGYFWLSYGDNSIDGKVAFAFDFNSADNYDHIYQYDGSNGTYYFGGTETLTAAAVYTANGLQKISAAGVGFSSASTDYTVEIYTGLTNENNPESGTLAATVTGKTSYAGFYTIEIDDEVIVDKGEKFGIVITAKKSDENRVRLLIDRTYINGGIEFYADTTNDKTFYKNDTAWVNSRNIKDIEPFTFRIKAYTRDPELSASEGDRVLTDDMLAEIAPQEYNGAKVEPELNLVFDGEKLQEKTDYTVEYRDNDKAGTATAVIRGIGSYQGEITAKFTITSKVITADMIDEIPGWIYDGEDHAPALEVYNGDNLMTVNTDYTVKYSKNSLNAAGTYTVTVSGKAPNYSGSAKKTFTVEKRDLTDADISLQYDTAEYTGKEIKPAVTVKAGENTIPAANYTVKYQDNKVMGTATVIITGKSNCQGTVAKSFEITPMAITADSISMKPATYTGSEVKPAVTVKVGSTTLKLNRDYELSYRNNIDATQEAIVTVKGIGNYSGTVEKAFEIKPQTVAANKIKAVVLRNGEAFEWEVTVNGKRIEETDYEITVREAGTDKVVTEWQPGDKYDITVELKGNYLNANGTAAVIKNVVCKLSLMSLDIQIVDSDETGLYSVGYTGSAYKPAVQVKDGETEISTKSYSVSYANNVNAGEASIIITGKGEYSGTRNISFEITKKQVDDLNVAIPAKTYTGSAMTPAVTIKDGSKKLKAGTDYTIDSYSDNVNASDAAKVHITLKNYELKEGETYETNITKLFKINPAKISSVKVGTSYYQGNNAEVKPSLMVTAGRIVLTENDYTSVYEGNDQGLTTKAAVTVEGKGNFTGTKKVTFKITKEPLSKVQVNGIADQPYTGSAVTLRGISLVNSNGDLIPVSDYTVTYKNNLKAGTASIIIKAADDGSYSGSVTKKFKIVKAELGNMIRIDPGSLAAKTYTGSKQIFTANEIAAAVTPVVPGGEQPTYKVSYRNNVNAGTATLILTGSGNYQGTVEIGFTIQPRSMSEVNVTLQQTTLPYLGEGSPALAKIKQVVYGKLKLTVRKDYTLSYVNSDKKGFAAVTLTGNGNYTGTKTLFYFIK